MAVMFVDNSGVDIVLGIFPFVRELLSRGTVVSCNGPELSINASIFDSCSVRNETWKDDIRLI